MQFKLDILLPSDFSGKMKTRENKVKVLGYIVTFERIIYLS